MGDAPCACLGSDYDDCEPSDFYDEKNPKARREHKCGECHRIIARGETYNRAAGKSDGSMWTFKTCSICDEIRKHFYCNGNWQFTALWEDIREQLFPNNFRFECMEGLSAIARERILKSWREWKGLR